MNKTEMTPDRPWLLRKNQPSGGSYAEELQSRSRADHLPASLTDQPPGAPASRGAQAFGGRIQNKKDPARGSGHWGVSSSQD